MSLETHNNNKIMHTEMYVTVWSLLQYFWLHTKCTDCYNYDIKKDS